MFQKYQGYFNIDKLRGLLVDYNMNKIQEKLLIEEKEDFLLDKNIFIGYNES
jgi:hypothetical protein